MHVVDEQQVDVVPIAAAELGHRPRLDAFDDLVDELLRPHVQEPHVGIALQDGVRDRLHQVRLAEARGAVDEQRVVGAPRGFRHGVGRGRRQLVRFADDERLERVPLVERHRDARRHPRSGLRSDEEIHLGPLLPVFQHAKYDRSGRAEDTLRRTGEQRRVLRVVPFRSELIRSAQHQAPVFQGQGDRWFEPGPHGGLRQFAPRLFEQALPSVFR